MKLLAQALIRLPFALDFCAIGSEVPPIQWQNDKAQFTLSFPPSLSEGTCGKSIFQDGWAWWTGERMVIDASLPIVPGEHDLDTLRAEILQEMNQVVRRFLNSCRHRFHRPDIHSVLIDSSTLALAVEHEDGHREAIPESADSFFYRSLPDEPPLERSINETTLTQLQRDLESGLEQPVSAQLALDAEWLHGIGEHERARAMEELAGARSEAT